jgi:hypothetical protein
VAEFYEFGRNYDKEVELDDFDKFFEICLGMMADLDDSVDSGMESFTEDESILLVLL